MTGKDLIKKYESLRLIAYLCPAGIPTIGWGHTKDVSIGDTCTKEQAEGWFDEDYNEAKKGLYKYVKVPLNENQEGALISFIFNLGVGNFSSSTLLKLLNQGKYLEASEQFVRWNKSKGRVLTGLTNRRLEEKQLFNTPVEV